MEEIGTIPALGHVPVNIYTNGISALYCTDGIRVLLEIPNDAWIEATRDRSAVSLMTMDEIQEVISRISTVNNLHLLPYYATLGQKELASWQKLNGDIQCVGIIMNISVFLDNKDVVYYDVGELLHYCSNRDQLLWQNLKLYRPIVMNWGQVQVGVVPQSYVKKIAKRVFYTRLAQHTERLVMDSKT